ncbi:phage minor head protein [Rhodospirillum sp. A1_3_36]|uniref:phage minor head protein n=1 Tax=Rhodospirillum sp. A1_3_36 TaxID=3391666 RepID=UPI0039A59EB3
MAEATAINLPFTEAIDYFKQKVNLPTAGWADLKEGMHARAFVVAGAVKEELLKDFREALRKALENGTTLADFRKDFESIVTKHGWSYNGSAGWRSRVIYDTNMRTARAAGKWQQINRALERERKRGRILYLRYVAVLDDRTRDQHRQWHGIILPADHPFWRTHATPNGWHCRCTIQVLTERDLARYGYTPSPEAEVPAIEMERRPVTLSDGSTTHWPTPKGIDTGFGHNPGQAAWGVNVDEKVMADWKASGEKDWESLGGSTWEKLGLPETLPVDGPRPTLGPPVQAQDAVIKAVRAVIGGEEKTYLTPDGAAVHVSAELLGDHIAIGRAPLVPILPLMFEDPAEVWLSWERHRLTGRVALRKRFLKLVELSKNDKLMAVANAVDGRFEAWTFIPVRSAGYINRYRKGLPLYVRK